MSSPRLTWRLLQVTSPPFCVNTDTRGKRADKSKECKPILHSSRGLLIYSRAAQQAAGVSRQGGDMGSFPTVRHLQKHSALITPNPKPAERSCSLSLPLCSHRALQEAAHRGSRVQWLLEDLKCRSKTYVPHYRTVVLPHLSQGKGLPESVALGQRREGYRAPAQVGHPKAVLSPGSAMIHVAKQVFAEQQSTLQ